MSMPPNSNGSIEGYEGLDTKGSNSSLTGLARSEKRFEERLRRKLGESRKTDLTKQPTTSQNTISGRERGNDESLEPNTSRLSEEEARNALPSLEEKDDDDEGVLSSLSYPSDKNSSSKVNQKASRHPPSEVKSRAGLLRKLSSMGFEEDRVENIIEDMHNSDASQIDLDKVLGVLFDKGIQPEYSLTNRLDGEDSIAPEFLGNPSNRNNVNNNDEKLIRSSLMESLGGMGFDTKAIEMAIESTNATSLNDAPKVVDWLSNNQWREEEEEDDEDDDEDYDEDYDDDYSASSSCDETQSLTISTLVDGRAPSPSSEEEGRTASSSQRLNQNERHGSSSESDRRVSLVNSLSSMGFNEDRVKGVIDGMHNSGVSNIDVDKVLAVLVDNETNATRSNQYERANQRNPSRTVQNNNNRPTGLTPNSYISERTHQNNSREQASNNNFQGSLFEIFPGQYARMLTGRQTFDAILNGTVATAPCSICTVVLQCCPEAEYVLCPDCVAVTPLRDRLSSGRRGSGTVGPVGLGCKLEGG